MFRHYTNAVFFPSIVVMALVMVLSFIRDYDYQSEWLTSVAAILISMATAFIYCFIMSLLSLTIFLNKKRVVGTNKVLSLLAWFLLPFGLVVLVFIHRIWYNLKYERSFSGDFLDLLVLNVPFILALIVTYSRYRKAVRHSGEMLSV